MNHSPWWTRPATAADADAVAAMVHDRAAWMAERGINGADGWDGYADEYGAQVADPTWPAWVMLDDDGRVAAVTTLMDECPAWMWPNAAGPALLVVSTVVHPRLAGRRVGGVLLDWVLDHAARRDRAWVGRIAFQKELAHYYADVQGWPLVRTVPCPDLDGATAWGFARPAVRIPGLPVTELGQANARAACSTTMTEASSQSR